MYAQDHCKTAADVWAAVRAARRWRMAMFPQPAAWPAPESAPIELEAPPSAPDPAHEPDFFHMVYWNGSKWEGDFARLIAAAYPGNYARFYSVKDIMAKCARLGGVKVADLMAKGRTPRFVRPRHVAMALAKHFTLQSLPDIGRRFGGRDHTTVLHATRKMAPVLAAAAATLAPDADLDAWAQAVFNFADLAQTWQRTRGQAQ